MRSGFTLLEMLVVTSIFIILTTIVLANYPRLNSQLTLGLVANDVALSIRQAQQYALGAVQRTGARTQAVSYGIHFDDPASTSNSDFLFADVAPSVDGDFSFTPLGTPYDPTIGKADLPSSVRIKWLCAGKAADLVGTAPNRPIDECILNGAGATKQTQLDIVFKRPNPEMNINGTPATAPSPYAEVVIVLGNTLGGNTLKEIHVTYPGQIYVQ